MSADLLLILFEVICIDRYPPRHPHMYVCVCVCMYIYKYIYIYIYTHVHNLAENHIFNVTFYSSNIDVEFNEISKKKKLVQIVKDINC